MTTASLRPATAWLLVGSSSEARLHRCGLPGRRPLDDLLGRDDDADLETKLDCFNGYWGPFIDFGPGKAWLQNNVGNR